MLLRQLAHISGPFISTEWCFSKTLQNTIATPLIKKTSLSKEDLKNCWPVSGLSFLSKLVELIVAARIRSHIHSNDLGSQPRT